MADSLFDILNNATQEQAPVPVPVKADIETPTEAAPQEPAVVLPPVDIAAQADEPAAVAPAPAAADLAPAAADPVVVEEPKKKRRAPKAPAKREKKPAASATKKKDHHHASSGSQTKTKKAAPKKTTKPPAKKETTSSSDGRHPPGYSMLKTESDKLDRILAGLLRKKDNRVATGKPVPSVCGMFNDQLLKFFKHVRSDFDQEFEDYMDC